MTVKDQKKERWKDIWALLGIACLVLLFLLPLLAGWEKMFFDDIAFDIYPQQVFFSQCLKKGTIPWWDPHTCAGAKPFYFRMFQSSLYPVNWLFLGASWVVPGGPYFWLIKAPLALHFLLSAAFAFIFARRGLRLNLAGAAVMALAYTLSPTMAGLASYPQTVFVQAWLPLLCLCLTAFSGSGRPGWLVLGAIGFALASTAGELQFVFHIILSAGLFSAGWAVIAFFRGDRRAAGRVVLGGFAVFGIGFLLAGLYWANTIVGLKMLLSGSPGTVDKLIGREQSIFPLYLITFFIPDFFGGVLNYHNWGAAYHIHLSLVDVNYLGGLAAVFLVVLGVYSGFRGKARMSEEVSLRATIRLFIALFGLSVIITLGPYTPLYRLLRLIMPVLGMPYPARLRSIQCFAMAGLLGTSASLLSAAAPWKEEFRSGRVLALYLAAVLIMIIPVLLWPYRTRYDFFSPGYRHLTHLNDWAWFINGPILYLMLVALLLSLSVWRLKGKYLIGFLVLLVLGESLFFAYGYLYRSRLLNRRDRDISAERYRGPEEHPAYRTVGAWSPEGPGQRGLYRRAYFRSYYENLAWVNGSLSIFGFYLQPLIGDFETAAKEVAAGSLYELRPEKWSSWFWSNMSVRYALTESPLVGEGMEFVEKVGPFDTYELKNAMPRFYFQDRWLVAGREEELNALLNCDLKDVGYCEEEVWRVRPYSESFPPHQPMTEAEWLAHFDSLQEKNRIIGADFSNPNRVVLDVEVSRPCMLVMTDVWHPDWRVTARGYPATLHRVNYLQSGVWCHPGRYRIAMEFLPASLRKGLAMTWLGVCGLIVLGVVAGRLRRRFKSANEGPGR